MIHSGSFSGIQKLFFEDFPGILRNPLGGHRVFVLATDLMFESLLHILLLLNYPYTQTHTIHKQA